MEDLLYRSESAIIPETLLYEYDEPGVPSIDLNSTSPEKLEASGLFTPFQLYNLLKYREKYGEIYSLYELEALPGFHQSKVLEIEPFVTLVHDNIYTGKKPLRHMVLLDVGKTFPNSIDYLEDSGSGNGPNYAGPPLKTTIRIR
ncbi:MAG: helix-hairpin-helix domain-containing protein, partial [Bacteroidales bacterium]|nr:helix-hairpin-helix domain-containing protein [Bacteroidales bacterium]